MTPLKKKIIVFDMDNTIVDEFGATVRPGVYDLLSLLKKEGHELVLWTNSKSERARQVILDNDLRQFFTRFIFREEYDPEDKGLKKDIRKVNGDILIDDDPDEIEYVKSLRRTGFLVKSYRKGNIPAKGEFAGLLKIL